MNENTVPGHLGGYTPGGDPATFYPELWTWLVEEFGAKTILDIGCGEGHSTRYFAELGAVAVGVDGVAQPQNHLVYQHDFTKGSLVLRGSFTRTGVSEASESALILTKGYDLAWCCEFFEHLEEKYARHLVPTFRSAKVVLLTHAFPGQGGHHHVNCQNPDYIHGFMVAAGFRYSGALTQTTRELAAKNTNPWNHYARSGQAWYRIDD